MAIENSVSNDFISTFVDSINIFDCHLPAVYSELPLMAVILGHVLPCQLVRYPDI